MPLVTGGYSYMRPNYFEVSSCEFIRPGEWELELYGRHDRCSRPSRYCLAHERPGPCGGRNLRFDYPFERRDLCAIGQQQFPENGGLQTAVFDRATAYRRGARSPRSRVDGSRVFYFPL